MTTAFSRLALTPLLEDAAAELALVESLTVTPWRCVETVAEGAARDARAHRATIDARAALDRWRRGEADSTRPPFAGPLQALRAYDEAHLDGPALPGSIFAQYQDHDTGPAERASRAVERTGDVLRLFEMCLADGWTLSTYPERIALTPVQAREVVVWSTLGCPGTFLPVQHPRAIVGPAVRPALVARHRTQRLPGRGVHDGDRFDRREPTAPEVAEFASAEFGVCVPVGHVVRLRHAGICELYGRLVLCGLVPRDRRLDTMAITTTTPWDIEGWKDIAAAMGCSVSLAQKLAERDENPAPVYLALKGVVAVRAELAKWLMGEMRPHATARARTQRRL